MTIDGKVVLVTGGTGSFGQKVTEIMLAEHNPVAVRIFSRGEYLQWEMQRRFDDSRLRFLIGDIRDPNRLHRALADVDVVIHAAALKHVPTIEYNPNEAVLTNIIGASNLIDCAIDSGVSKVIALSSDKACYPVNLYGATKLAAEKLFTQGNVYSGNPRTLFSNVRYGNVIGSRGSIIPLFLEQAAKTGTVTVTDERMTRFWLSVAQGARFVLSCIDWMQGGEVYVPKVPSMSVMGVAAAVAPEAEVKITGIRAGEKLHEVLISEEESRRATEYEDRYIIAPDIKLWEGQADYQDIGIPCRPGMKYSSDQNDTWLTPDDLWSLYQETGA